MTKDKPRQEWGPVRPFTNWPPIEPQPFDTRDSTYIPDLSVADSKVQKLSSRKIRGVGMKMYQSANTTIAASANTDLTYNTIAWQRGIDTPDGFPVGCGGFLLPHSGVWLITVSHFWVAAQGTVQGFIWINDSTALDYSGGSSGTALASTPYAYTLTSVTLFDAGTRIGVRAYQYNDGAANRDITGGAYTNSLTAVLLYAV